MATGLKRGRNVDYKQLDSFSSVVLFDTAGTMRKRGRFFEVERVITRRRIPYDHEYLIKWKDWPLNSCSWEPSTNLTQDLLLSYDKPVVRKEQLEVACQEFCVVVNSTLKGKSNGPVYANINLDVWRHVTFGKGVPCEHRGHYLFEKDDFELLNLPNYWWCHLNHDGQGNAVDFPIKVKAILTWSPVKFIPESGTLKKEPRFPIEKVCLTIIKKACDVHNFNRSL